MSTKVQRRRGSTAEHSSFTGAVGELTVDTDKDTVVVHDGSTAGGAPLMREDGSNSSLALGSAASPSLKWDANTGIYSPGADQVAISTGGVQRINIEADGDINIDSGGVFYDATNNRLAIGDNAPGSTLTVKGATGVAPLQISGPSSEFCRVTSDGKLLVGTSLSTSFNHQLQVRNDSGSVSEFFTASASVGLGPYSVFSRSRGSAASPAIVNKDDALGVLYFSGYSGSAYTGAATIAAEVDGTPGANDMPGRLVFSTADGASSPTEKLRIASDGLISIANDSTLDKRRAYFANGADSDFKLGFRNGSGNTTNSLHCLLDFAYTTSTIGRIGFWRGAAGDCYRIDVVAQTNGVYLAANATSWTGYSDERLKTDLKPIENGLDKVSLLRAVTGRFKTDEEGTSRSFLIAQDVQAVLPEAVDNSDPEKLGLSYTDVIPLLVAALKESKERIETLEAKVAALEAS